MRDALVHPHLRHPLTGLPLRAVGVVNGRVVWPTLGGAPDGDDGGSGDGQGDGQSGGTESGSESSQATETGKSSANGNGQSSGQSSSAEKVEDLPEWAQKQIRELRTESGNARTGKKAAEQAQAQQLDALAKALGFKQDEKVDPDQLAKDLTAAQASQRQAAVELAVFRAAGKHEGDADALLDSRAFLAKLVDLDPTAKDFASKVDTAIKDAVKDNPKLKTARAAGASSVDHSGQTGERRSNETRSLADSVSGHYGT